MISVDIDVAAIEDDICEWNPVFGHLPAVVAAEVCQIDDAIDPSFLREGVPSIVLIF